MIESPINNSILFEKFSEFTANFSGDVPIWIDTNKYEVPDMLRDYQYPVSAWPVVISPQVAGELNQLTIQLPKLLGQLPSLYFNNDIRKIAAFYFGGDEMVTQFALMCHEKNIEIGCRLDLTLTSEGFKVLEVNVGSSIGGWQVQSFESIIRQLHSPLTKEETAHNFESRNTQAIYIKFLVDNILKHQLVTNKELNIFIEIGDMAKNEEEKDRIQQFFDGLLKQELKARGLTGEAYIGALSTLTLGNTGRLFLNNKCFHAVLIFNMEKEKVSPVIFRSFLMDKVYFPDHLGTQVLGDKRNLALLRVLAERGVFSAEDNALILQYIPWTSPVEDRNVVFKDREYKLLSLMADNKDQFVIKAAGGFQGKNVFVGRFLSQQEWENATNIALGKSAFIAQEFSESLDFLAPNAANKWVPHKLIWGAFGFGEHYGGVWVRMSSAKTDLGVINSATGAIEAIVYEWKD